MAFDQIKLEKGMYHIAGKPFDKLLEELDPSAHYEGTELSGLDAFQRQLKRFDIKVGGPHSDVVDKFFSSSNSAVLFPEYIVRAVRAGMEENNPLESIVAAKTLIDSNDYRTITSAPSEEDRELKRVSQGAKIPETYIRAQDNLVKLYKRGRMLVASYEAIRNQRLDLFTVALKQIGAMIASSQMKDAVSTLINGDGNNNPISTVTVSGDLDYSQLVELWSELDPYEMNTILASPDAMAAILNLPEFQNPLAGLNFEGTGRMVTPMGARLFKTSALGTGELIGLDKRYALEMVCMGDVSIEYDKLIDRQLERAAVTSTAGFAKIFTDAAKMIG